MRLRICELAAPAPRSVLPCSGPGINADRPEQPCLCTRKAEDVERLAAAVVEDMMQVLGFDHWDILCARGRLRLWTGRPGT